MVARRVLKWIVGVTAIAVAGVILLAAPVLWVIIDDSALPPEPDLPAGITVLSRDVSCGSGGCYRELLLVGSRGQSGTEVIAELGLQVGAELCRARSLIDRRSACTYVGGLYGDEVDVSVYYDRNGSRV